LNCKDMAKKAIESVQNKRIIIIPSEAEKQWYRWLENIKDWCLSRQLWWGHRIPAYKVRSCNEWYVGKSKEEIIMKNKNIKYEELEQDEDVLDTWFSSGLWPFAILGWPENTSDFMRYYPTSILETGSDILFFWVARMVMLGIELTGKEPFNQILLHGIVRDAHGRKMSKSLGNVIDPIFVIDGCSLEGLISCMKSGNLASNEVKKAEVVLRKDFPNGISKCGADALRFTLLSYTSGMKDINLNILRVEGYRRFCNKIWNAQKFVKLVIDEFITKDLSNIPIKEDYKKYFLSSSSLERMKDDGSISWILKKRNETIESVEKALNCFNFMTATQIIHQFFIYDFCDIFIEIVKNNKTLNHISILLTVFIDCMKILHPFMPFITEEVFSNYFDTSISISSYPKVDESEHHNKFPMILSIVKYVRGFLESKEIKKVMIEIIPGNDINEIDLIFINSLCKKVSEIKVVKEITETSFEKIGDSKISIHEIN